MLSVAPVRRAGMVCQEEGGHRSAVEEPWPSASCPSFGTDRTVAEERGCGTKRSAERSSEREDGCLTNMLAAGRREFDREHSAPAQRSSGEGVGEGLGGACGAGSRKAPVGRGRNRRADPPGGCGRGAPSSEFLRHPAGMRHRHWGGVWLAGLLVVLAGARGVASVESFGGSCSSELGGAATIVTGTTTCGASVSFTGNGSAQVAGPLCCCKICTL